MKKFFALAVAVALSTFSFAQAGRVYFTGDVGLQPAGKTSGVINVLVDLNAGQTMANGGITLTVTNDNPSGGISFADAEALNPGNRWTIASDTTAAGLIQFNTASVLSPALPAGGTAVPFATINWTKSGDGRSNIAFDLVPETFVNGDDGDVTSQYTAENNFVSFPTVDIPEPGTLAMAGMSLIGLAFRRRNG